MTIEKAIETLTQTPYLVTHEEEPNFKSALNLLIEAGKRYQDFRSNPEMIRWEPLPGETKD